PFMSRSGRPTGPPGVPWQHWPSVGQGCTSTHDQRTANRERHRPEVSWIGRTRSGDLRLGGYAARGSDVVGAFSHDRRFRETARLAVGNGAGPENRSG